MVRITKRNPRPDGEAIVQIGIRLRESAVADLYALAKADFRGIADQVAWLINEETKRRKGSKS